MEGNQGFIDTLGFLHPLPPPHMHHDVNTNTTTTTTAPAGGHHATGVASANMRRVHSHRTSTTATAIATTPLRSKGAGVSALYSSTSRGGSRQRVELSSPVKHKQLSTTSTRQRLTSFTRQVLDSNAELVGVATDLGLLPPSGQDVIRSGGGNSCCWLCSGYTKAVFQYKLPRHEVHALRNASYVCVLFLLCSWVWPLVQSLDLSVVALEALPCDALPCTVSTPRV